MLQQYLAPLVLTLCVSLTLEAPTRTASTGLLDTPAVGSTKVPRAHAHDRQHTEQQGSTTPDNSSHAFSPKLESTRAADGVVSFGMVFTVELPSFITVGGKKYRLSIRMPGASGMAIH